MREQLPERLERGRVLSGPFASNVSFGPNGKFNIYGPKGENLVIVASNASNPIADGWEHVSISTRRRTPNWTEMCFVKDLFWEPHELVIQFHPPESEWINNHPYCLHLWHPIDGHIRLPPGILVGRKDLGTLNEETAALAWAGKI